MLKIYEMKVLEQGQIVVFGKKLKKIFFTVSRLSENTYFCAKSRFVYDSRHFRATKNAVKRLKMKISEKFEKIRARLDDTQPTESTKKQSDHFEILVDLPTVETGSHW